MLQAKPGPRGRTEHRITGEGRRVLKSGWRELVEAGPSGDLDADLRVALLALWVGGDRRMAANFLKALAAGKLESIRSMKEPDHSVSLPALAIWYDSLRSASAKVLLRAESAAAIAMARSLPRQPYKRSRS